MRFPLLAAIALPSLLAGCLQPVQVLEPPEPCYFDSDCAPPPADACAPAESFCEAGRCKARDLATIWEGDPGACAAAADCLCQALDRDACVGSFACERGRCLWQCGNPTDCMADGECAAGQVCEPTGTGCEGPRACMSGCRDAGSCEAGEICAQFALCEACPCPKSCGPSKGCKSDEQCPRGSVCERSPGGSTLQCLTGCRSEANCPSQEICDLSKDCAACEDCLCLGECIPRPIACTGDDQCGPGLICGEDRSCARACVPGCRSDAQCPMGQSCSPQICSACGCATPVCQSLGGCAGDAQCKPGTVCEPTGPGCAGASQCVPGCHEDWQCAPGQSCALGDCIGCPCPGACVGKSTCSRDGDCPRGQVCEAGPGCVSDFRCVEGCHDKSQCKPGQLCQQVSACLTCPCPGNCMDDPCVDRDGDGYAAVCASIVCPGLKGTCDCNDRDPSINPGARERCGNGADDNCDGKVDEGCGCNGLPLCRGPADCAWGKTFCDGACCRACAVPPQPRCPPDSCLYPGGHDGLGCPQTAVCAPCCACPEVYAPVCGTNYATYGNSCEARCAGTTILHDGACLLREGATCGWGPGSSDCGREMYCRDTCPMCDALVMRCTKSGACVGDWDCPAGLPAPTCADGTKAKARCAMAAPSGPGKCQFSCP